MNRRSRTRTTRATVCAAVATLAFAPAAAGDVPGQVAELQQTVGEAIAQAPIAPTPKPAPAAPAPAPRPVAAAPQAPSPAATRSQAPAPAPRATAAQATPGGDDASAGQAAPADRKPAVARAARSRPAAETVDAPEPATRLVLASAGDLGTGDGGEESPSTLPFTGYPLLPLMGVAVLMLFAGIGLRRVVRPR